jgi:hypothetical protein
VSTIGYARLNSFEAFNRFVAIRDSEKECATDFETRDSTLLNPIVNGARTHAVPVSNYLFGD